MTPRPNLQAHINQLHAADVLSALLDTFPLPVTVWRGERLIKVNEAFELEFGWGADQVTGRPWREFVIEEDMEESVRVAQNQIDARVPLIHFVNRWRRPSGRVTVVRWTVGPPREEDSYSLAIAEVLEITGERSTDA